MTEAAHSAMTLTPLYCASVAALMGIVTGTKPACQGMVQMPAPDSIAAMICSVTVRYTSNFDSERTVLLIDISRAQRERRIIPALPNARETKGHGCLSKVVTRQGYGRVDL